MPGCGRVQQAREQRRAVDAIARLKALVAYDYEFDASGGHTSEAKRPGPDWLRERLGLDFVTQVVYLDLSEGAALRWTFVIFSEGPNDALDVKVTDEDLRNVARLGRLECLWLDHVGVSESSLQRLDCLRRSKSLNVWDHWHRMSKTACGESEEAFSVEMGFCEFCGSSRAARSPTPGSNTLDDCADCRFSVLTVIASPMPAWHTWASSAIALPVPYVSPGHGRRTGALGRSARTGRVVSPASKVTHGGLERLKNLSKLRELSLCETEVAGAGFARLKGLRQLEVLNVGWTPVDDDALQRLKDFSEREELSLADTKDSTGPGLANLEGLGKLEVLDLDGTQIDDDALQHLKGAAESADSIACRHSPSPTTDWSTLRGWTGLRSLTLSTTCITDVGLEQLRG